MGRMTDKAHQIFEEIADLRGLEVNSFEYSELEREFWEDPADFVRHYGSEMAQEDRRFLGYFDEVEGSPNGTATVEDILENWPAPPPRPEFWSRHTFESMSGSRRALLLGCGQYDHPIFDRLVCPRNDVRAFQQVLRSRKLGHFNEVEALPAKVSASDAVERITHLLRTATAEDTLLIYFSGHGYASERGDEIFLALKSTDPNQPESAIDGNTIVQLFAESQCASLLLILDCCQSGAVAAQIGRYFRARPRLPRSIYHKAFGQGGLRVLTSATRGQHAYEDPNNKLSIFTSCLLDGIRTGKADTADKGVITDGDAFWYARRKLSSLDFLDRQTPSHNIVDGRTPYLLSLNDQSMPRPSLAEVPLELVERFVAIRSMVDLVNACEPIVFNVVCTGYRFNDADAIAIASGLNVSADHTPFLRQTQKGFVCDTYFAEPMVPDAAKRSEPINGLVQSRLDVDLADVNLIYGIDLRNMTRWTLFVPEGTVVT